MLTDRVRSRVNHQSSITNQQRIAESKIEDHKWICTSSSACSKARRESEIKRAYRRLARRFHPDINPGDQTAAARFRQILEAYETLIDPSSPIAVRLWESDGRRLPSQASGFEGFDFSTRGVDYSATFGDLFAEVLTERGARQPSAQRGADLHHGDAGHVRGSAHGRPAGGDGDAARDCRACAGSGRTGRARAPVSVPGHRRGAHRARPHGVLAQLRRVQRNRPAAAAAVRAVRGQRAGDAKRDSLGPHPGRRRRRRSGARAGQGQRRLQRRSCRRPVRHGAGRRRIPRSGARATIC